MAIDPALIKWYRCATWTEGDTHGGDIDLTSEIISGADQNIFDDVSNAERETGDVEYRKIFIRNENADTWNGVISWISSGQDSSNNDVHIGIALGTDAGTKTDEGTGLTYVQPTAKADGNALSIGNLAQNEYQAIWIRRTVDASALGYTNLQFVISAESS